MVTTKREHAIALYTEGIRDGNVRAAVETDIGDRYTQHSTGVADGVEMEGGVIVEHWDNSEPVPEHDVNTGKF